MGTPKWIGTTGALIEQPNSPATEFAEKSTRTRTYKGQYALCLSSALPRGTWGSGSDAGWQVAKSTVSKDRGGVGTLAIVHEAGGSSSGAELPPVKFGCPPEKIPVALRRHPRYAGLSEAILDAIDKAMESDSLRGNDFYNKLATIPLALELYNKRKRGMETFVVYGSRYFWTFASWTMPSYTLGGYIEVPGGPMEGYLPSGTWLREADEFEFTGTYYLLTRSWIGTPEGNWDTDIYSS